MEGNDELPRYIPPMQELERKEMKQELHNALAKTLIQV
jgi:hypothetical protein